MAGITPEGIEILRLPDVVDALRDKAREIWADTVPEGEVVNVDDDSAIGRQIGVVAPSGADLWEAIQEVYNAFDPNTASGISLDNIVAIGGVVRKPSSATTATCLVTGNTNTVIGANSKISSSTTGRVYYNPILTQLARNSATGVGISPITVANNTIYTITYAQSNDLTGVDITVTTPVSGTTLVSLFDQFQTAITASHPELTSFVQGNLLFVRSVDPFQLFSYSASSNIGITKVIKPLLFIGEEVGAVEQPAGTMDIIATPILGWDSVTNPTDASIGGLLETDEELRERFRNSKFEKATNVIESLYTAILGIQGVLDLKIYENDTNIVDSNGVNGHSFLTIVNGGLGTSIAQAIWENKPIGILSQGDTTVTVLDSQGLPHDVSFTRPTLRNVFIEIDLDTNSSFPSNGEQLIKDALITHFSGLRIGDDVIYSRLYTPINSVAGHQVNSLKIGTSPSPTGTTNVVIDFDEIATTDSVSITFI